MASLESLWVGASEDVDGRHVLLEDRLTFQDVHVFHFAFLVLPHLEFLLRFFFAFSKTLHCLQNVVPHYENRRLSYCLDVLLVSVSENC
jgi:hypothetical protein